MPIEITMPALSPTMEHGNLAKWVVKEGDKVEPGQVIAEIETDKATMEVEVVDEGVIGKILVKEGTQDVAVNEVIALLLEEGEDKKAIDSYKPKKAEIKEEPEDEHDNDNEKSDTPKKSAKQPQGGGGAGLTPPPVFVPSSSQESVAKSSDFKASPIAKRLAADAGINIESLTGTGPKGRVVKSDIEMAIKNGGSSSNVVRNPVEVTAIPNDNMRKVIASRLLQSKQHVPHFYLSVDCELDKLLEVRKDLNDSAYIDSDSGQPVYKLSVNDLIIKAVGKALKKVPQANASWTDNAIMQYNNVDVSVAVATDGGLITPIIKNADQKSLPVISNQMKELAARARKNALKPEEFQGGGFSISNLGMYGIKNFSAIVNPPQGCILAVGAGEQKAVVKNGSIVPATVMSVTLSCDHRVVDGAVGAEFLAVFKDFIQRPVTMLV
ncbi:MAG: pyruvate dehydrogenase complex dihydrolipoamide acetyltransferase [Rickettsiales bacterium]|nr:pyruvate dehydrogenase complex dihydrolipoamide acetyltransferase [Pseudomonadota bacterium]MDA0965517.1 pyruvate dehydrogenase complex dihydrolipoamide acetyltransferase [Pseudomonadota bacterium]MDG4542841.1 pyruvate dehydrogenase complex dihydrolipoamide acetyltransferase [Rickettsiales bacterium]MDG4544711.1 pyruvate dehydrogenase complex dihydrolipoamide acetyltransferase [Rickettsiales bacterium]MDG4546833.1 pyruvate dehydrogenase complex dihydrolipoamide acetyltransferase [Rickettsial